MIDIRPADPAERSALEDLQLRASIAWAEYRQLLVANRDAIELPVEQLVEGRTFVAESDGEIVGFGVIVRRTDGNTELDGLFVEPNAWRTGIGTRLVKEAERRAISAGSTALHVIANPRAEAFYLACGFAFVGEEQTRFGIARSMKKTLMASADDKLANGDNSSSLKIAVLGAGKIGSTFAFQFARAGHHEVTVIARPGSVRLQQLQRDNGIVDVSGERARVRVIDALDEETPYDLLIVTLLDHQAITLLPMLQRCAAKCVQFMFNTFYPERLQDAIAVARCTFGMPFVQARLESDGRLRAAIGAGGQKTIMSEQRWVAVFNAAGLPAALEPDMLLWLRCHVPLCVAFESVAVAGERLAGGASWAEAIVLARGVQTSFELIKGLGYRVYPRGKQIVAACPIPVLATMLWCMSRIRSFREVLATGEAECRILVDDMVAAAPRAKKPVDVSRIQAMKPRQRTG